MRISRSTSVFVTLLGAFVFPLAAEAQWDPRGVLSLEARGGFASPTEDFGDGDPGLEPEPGLTLGADLMVNLTPQVTAYGGFGWTRFDCEGALCTGDADFTSSGFDAGIKLLLPLGGTVQPWARAGALLHELKFENDEFSATSDRPFGLDSAVGADILLGERAALTPAVRYNRYTAEIDLGPLGSLERTVSFLNLDLGFHFHL